MATEPLSAKSLTAVRTVVAEVIDTVEEKLGHEIPAINALELAEINFNSILKQFPAIFQQIISQLLSSSSSTFLQSSNTQPLAFALNNKNVVNDLADVEQILQRMNRGAATSFENMLKQLENDGVIVRGKTTSGLLAPASVRAPVKGGAYEGPTFGGGIASVGEVKSSDAVTGRQPGILEGTGVLFANSNPDAVPQQQIIDALDKLGITLQITPNGGKISKPTGTNSKQNHVEGYAADFQVVRDGRVIYPRDYPDIYGGIVSTLQSNANGNSIRPGIGGYPTYIHYDESPYRQKLYPGSKVAWWNNGFPVENYLSF